jgi:hypothetical protein
MKKQLDKTWNLPGVPDSSVFTATKPIKTTYSYNKLSVGNLSIMRELQSMKNRIIAECMT